MNPKDLSEIKRRLNPDRRYPTVLRGCYLGADGHLISTFTQDVGRLPQEECEKYMAIFRRCLSGTAGQNLLNIDFDTEDAGQEEARRQLAALCDTALKDDAAVTPFYQQVIAWAQASFSRNQSVEEQQAASNHLVLLLHDGYDVPHRTENDELDRERSESVLSYVLCAVCPVKQAKPALRYFAAENEFHAGASDWVVSAPEIGFMYPAFEERGANISRAVYYTRDAANPREDFVSSVFHAAIQMTAPEQQQAFQALLTETLAEECSMETVQSVHDTIRGMIEAQKADKTAEPLCMSRKDVTRVLEECGVSEEKTAAFEEKYRESFGDQAEIPAVNMVTPKQFKVDTPSVTIRIDPEHSDLVETRIIDGKSYIMILADGDVEVNGVKIRC